MRKITLVLIAVAVVLTMAVSGCNKSPTSPNSAGPVIIAMIAQQGTGISYSAMITSASMTPVTGCNVTVSSAHGTTTLVDTMGVGDYIYQSTDQNDFQAGQTYTVNINNNGTAYSASGKAPGGASVAADGSTANWSSEGNQDTIMAFDPLYNSYQYGPDLTSGFNLVNAGLYTHGSGQYTISTHLLNELVSSFSNAGVASVLSLSEQESFTVTKP